jgi:hypothetical protein
MPAVAIKLSGRGGTQEEKQGGSHHEKVSYFAAVVRLSTCGRSRSRQGTERKGATRSNGFR